MSAFETECFRPRLVEFRVAYLTITLVVCLKCRASKRVLLGNRRVELNTDLLRKLARFVREKLLLKFFQVPLEVPEEQDGIVLRHAHGLSRRVDLVGHCHFYVGKLKDLEAALYRS